MIEMPKDLVDNDRVLIITYKSLIKETLKHPNSDITQSPQKVIGSLRRDHLPLVRENISSKNEIK